MNNHFSKYILTFFYLIIFTSACIAQDSVKIIKYEIDEINIKFTGKKSFEENDLKNLLSEREGDDFDLAFYLQDIERLKKYYFDNGFFDVVVDTNLIFNIEDEEVIENFIVKENDRYRYNEIKYSGLDSIDNTVEGKLYLPKEMLVYKGKFYSKDTIKLEMTRIVNLLQNNGYATATSENPDILKYETNLAPLKHKVNVTLIFKTGLKYYFGTTKIVFKSKKKYNVTARDIEREITYNEGDIYSKDQVINSELNLGKISILDNPRIAIDSLDSINKRVDLVINAIIGNKYNLTPEIFGYYFQNIFYIGPGISFSDKYFLGGGRTLTTTARFYFHSFKNNRLEFVNTIFQPFLFNNRNISGSWNIGAEYRLDEISNRTQINNSFGLGYDLPNYTYVNRLNAKWNIQNTRIVLKTGLDTLQKIDFNIFTSTFGIGAIHNSVNNIQFPFKGNYQSFDIEESGLLGNLVKKFFDTETESYIKFTNSNFAYVNLSRRDINVSSALAGKLSTGLIVEYGNNNFVFNGEEVSGDIVPRDSKFVCGGSSSVRGWGAKQLGIVTNKNVGGNFILESTIEHRTRPFLDAKNIYFRDLGFATFIDWGNVWSEIGKFKLNEIAIAAGGGIRYYTVIGAIRFDIGLKIYDPQPGPVGGSNWIFGSGARLNDKYNFQFGIGNTF